MKNLIFTKILMAAIVLPMTFAGCSKDDDDSSSPSGSNNKGGEKKGFAFVKDGEHFDYSESASYNPYVAIIQAQNKRAATRPFNQVSLGLDSIRLGQIKLHDTISSPSARYTEFYPSTAEDPQIDYKAISGEINIESFNKEKETASGTFQFVGVSRSSDTVRITNGEFNIKE